MKVILLKDIKKVGKKDEIKEFSDGYAINYLIPNKLGLIANDEAIKSLNKKMELVELNKKTEEKELELYILSINNKEIIFEENTDKTGHLFKSLNFKNIKDKIKKLYPKIEESYIEEINPIKQTGDYSVNISILIKDKNIKSNLIIKVINKI